MPVDAYDDDETGGEHQMWALTEQQALSSEKNGKVYAEGEEEVLDDTYGQKWMEDPASRTFSEKNYGRALQMMSLINARARAPFLRRGTRSSEL